MSVGDFPVSYFEKINFDDLESCVDILRDYIDSGHPYRYMHHLLKKKYNEPKFEQQEYNTEGQYTLYSNSQYSLDLRLDVKEKSKTVDPRIFVGSTRIVLANLGAGTIVYEMYKTPEDFHPEIFDPKSKLIPNGIVELKPGSIISINGLCEAARAINMTDDCLQLALISAPIRSQNTIFDSKTLLPIYNSSASTKSSRIIYSMDLLRIMGSESSVDVIEEYTKHKDHFVRWEAVRNLFALSEERGVAVMKKLVDDPHPHIRDSAQSFLVNYSN